jgi:hypothetical protein
MDDEYEFLPAPLVCPLCNQEFDYVEDQWEYTCMNCGNPVENINAQFAYSRGYDAFFAGQHLFMEIPPKRRSNLVYAKQAQDVTALFIEAYSAIQVAFEADLADSQREKGIEIMASIAHLFMQTGLVSPLEANYWTTLMIEQTNRKEYEDLKHKLAQSPHDLLNFFTRVNWRRRKRLLEKALVRVETKIQQIEQNIAFVTPPRVRKTISK